jgi:hypothetical protein
MILGVSFLHDRLLLALHFGAEKGPEFLSFPVDLSRIPGSPPEKSAWQSLGEEAAAHARNAEKVVFSIPSPLCYLRKVEIDRELTEESKTYFDWLASTQLPGDISSYSFEFLPLRKSFDGSMMEMVFFAAPVGQLNNALQALRLDDESQQIRALPEQLGLVRVIEKSLARDDIPQAGIVNFEKAGASAVYVKSGRYDHCRFFSKHPNLPGDLPTDVETYFLSRADSSESLPLVITGSPEEFKTSWSPIVPAFMGIHHLEYAGAWGVADYVSAEVR